MPFVPLSSLPACAAVVENGDSGGERQSACPSVVCRLHRCNPLNLARLFTKQPRLPARLFFRLYALFVLACSPNSSSLSPCLLPFSFTITSALSLSLPLSGRFMDVCVRACVHVCVFLFRPDAGSFVRSTRASVCLFVHVNKFPSAKCMRRSGPPAQLSAPAAPPQRRLLFRSPQRVCRLLQFCGRRRLLEPSSCRQAANSFDFEIALLLPRPDCSLVLPPLLSSSAL